MKLLGNMDIRKIIKEEIDDFEWTEDMTDDIVVGTCIKLHDQEYECVEITDKHYIMKIKNPNSMFRKYTYEWDRESLSKNWGKMGMSFCDESVD